MNSSSTHTSFPNNPSSTKTGTPCSSNGTSTIKLKGTINDTVESPVDFGLYSGKPVIYDENIAFSRRPRTEYDNIINALSNVLLKYFVDKVEMEKCLAPETFEDKSFVEEEFSEICNYFKEPTVPRNPSSESFDSEKEKQKNIKPEPEVPEIIERPRGLSLMSRQSRASSSKLAKLKKNLDHIKEATLQSTTRYPSRMSIKSIKSVAQDEASEETEDPICDNESREDVNDPDYFLKYKGRDQNVVVEFKNGNKYEGRISCFMMEGEGTYTWKDGTKFEGSFINGVAQGRGHFSWPDESWYNGEVKNNLRHGRGVCVIKKPKGLVYYIGKWKEGKRHGSGIILFGEYDWYDGKWKNDKMHGRGLRQYPTGSRYLGEWRNGEPHGEGTMVWSQRDTYTGKWKTGKMHGRGTYTWRAFKATNFVFPLQNIYDGYWKNGKRHGFGRLLLASGAVILTKWVNDKKEGPGQIICKNGLIFDSPFLFSNDKLCNIGRPIVVPPWNKWYYDFLLPYQDGIVVSPEIECESALIYDEYEKQIGYFSSKMPPLGNKRKGCLNNIPLLATVQTMPLWKFIEKSFEEEGLIKYENGNLYMTEETVKSMSFEELWLRKVLSNRISDLNIIYQHYAKHCCDEQPKYNCFLLRFMLEQMCMDCGIENTSYNLSSLNQEIGFGSYPFDVVPLFQMIHYLLYLTYSMCVKHRIINHNIPGLWGGAFDYFISNVAVPAMKKENTLIQICQNLPINEVYNIYIIIGVPVTMIKILTFFSISEEDEIFGNINFICRIPIEKKGKNIIYPDGSIVFDEGQNKDTAFENTVKSTESYLGLHELASLGDTIIKDALFTTCSMAYEDPTIIYDYEVSFLEFCKFIMILIEEYKNLTYNLSEGNEVFHNEEVSSKDESKSKKEDSIVHKNMSVNDLSRRPKHDGLSRNNLIMINGGLDNDQKLDVLNDIKTKYSTETSKHLAHDGAGQIQQIFEDSLEINTHPEIQEVVCGDTISNRNSREKEPNQTNIGDSDLNCNTPLFEEIEIQDETGEHCQISSSFSNCSSIGASGSNIANGSKCTYSVSNKIEVRTAGISNIENDNKNSASAELNSVGTPLKSISHSLGINLNQKYEVGLQNNTNEDQNHILNEIFEDNTNYPIIYEIKSKPDPIYNTRPNSMNSIININLKDNSISNNRQDGSLELNSNLDKLLPDNRKIIQKIQLIKTKKCSNKIKSNTLGYKANCINSFEQEHMNLKFKTKPQNYQTKHLNRLHTGRDGENIKKNYEVNNDNYLSKPVEEESKKFMDSFKYNKKEFLDHLKHYHRSISKNGSQTKLSE